jgi:hypothetical protein
MFRETMCPSSGENIVPMRHLVFVTLYRWLSGMQGGLHTRQSSIYSDRYQVSHRYGIFSLWCEHSCLKHVEKYNKYIKKNCAPSWFSLHDYTRMHGQQNENFTFYGCFLYCCVRDVSQETGHTVVSLFPRVLELEMRLKCTDQCLLFRTATAITNLDVTTDSLIFSGGWLAGKYCHNYIIPNTTVITTV